MRRIPLGLFLAGCTVLTAQAQDVPAYLNVELKNPEDQRFMELVQLRADRWVKAARPLVFDRKGAASLTDMERSSLDSLPLIESGTWQLNVVCSPGYDTLALVGLTKSFHNSRVLFHGGPNTIITEPIDAPRYVLPLVQYKEFLSPTEFNRLMAIVEDAVRSIAIDHYKIGSHTITSIPWAWNGPDDWPLFTPDMAFTHLIGDWCLSDGRNLYSAPDFLSAVPIQELNVLVYQYDTVYTVWEGDTSLVRTSWRKHISALEFLFQPELVELEEWAWDRGFITTCNWIGLTFEGEEHSSVWMPKEDFVKAGRIPQLGGWLDAIFANEVAKRLQTRY